MDRTREIISRIRPGQSVGIFIGPEGGFEREEVEQALDKGPRPLRWAEESCARRRRGWRCCPVLMFQLEE